MYFFSFIKSLFKPHKIPVIIYLVLNVAIITFIFNLFTEAGSSGEFDPISIPIALGAYTLSVMIALSPIGEWVLRLQLGCKKIKRMDYAEYLTPIFREVYGRAKQVNPSLPDNIELCMSDDDYANAFATGRKTICVTKGMIEKTSAMELKGVLAHEFAHIANHDTDLIRIVTVGNFMITALVLVIRIVFKILSIFGWVDLIIFRSRGSQLAILFSAIGDLIILVLMFVWTKLGQYLVLATSRSDEYQADEFAHKLGYSVGLCTFLDRIVEHRAKGVLAVISSSHPSSNDRISRLQQIGSSYRAFR